MQCSFSFCGTDVEDIGLHYAAENSQTYVFNPSNAKAHEETFDGHHGGYYFGSTYEPKTFTLRCYYEDNMTLDGVMTDIYRLFKVGRSGRLVFTMRPWVYYIATVLNVDTSKLLNLKNGFVTITLRAYYPYSRTDETYIDTNNEFCWDMRNNSAIPEGNILPDLTIDENITAQTEFILINGGTCNAALKVDIAGDVGDGVTLYNTTTGQEMRFQGLNSGSSSKYVECDGLTGNCYWVSSDSQNGKGAFLYHSKGFIDLEPSGKPIRDLNISTTAGSSTITVNMQEIPSSARGRYIYADGQFRAIREVGQDGSTLTVFPVCTNSTTADDAIILDANRLILTPDNTMNLTYLAFQYDHTFS